MNIVARIQVGKPEGWPKCVQRDNIKIYVEGIKFDLDFLGQGRA